jgi:hypothetical protein
MNPDLQKSMAFGNVASPPPFVLVGRGGEDGYRGLVECYVRVALCQPQISHGLAWDRAHAPAARGRLLT